jgi:hypothetical protein
MDGIGHDGQAVGVDAADEFDDGEDEVQDKRESDVLGIALLVVIVSHLSCGFPAAALPNNAGASQE